MGGAWTTRGGANFKEGAARAAGCGQGSGGGAIRRAWFHDSAPLPRRLPPLREGDEPPPQEHAALRVLFPRVPLAVSHQLGERARGWARQAEGED